MANSKQDSGPVSPTSQRMRARIIAAVIDAVDRHGISGTTLANVASLAEVSQGVLVFHFKTKQGLLSEVLRRLNEEYEEAWRPAVTAPDPLDRILGLIAADFGASVCTRKRLALWFAFWGEAGAKPLYHAICEEAEMARHLAMVAACEALAAVDDRPDPALLAQSIDGMTDGLWLQMHISGGRVGRKAAHAMALAHLRLLLPGLASRI